MSVVIEVDRLHKVYGTGAQRKVALESLSFQVRRGEVFGFLGPNGAGKTTAIKILTGLVAPTSGTATVLGRPPGDSVAKAKLGYLPEHFRFYDWLTGRELLDFYGRLARLDGPKRRIRIAESLERVGLAAAGDVRLRNYSKGMQQRLGIAQALLHQPELVLLDEPTSALDPLGRREVRDLIRQLKAEGVTVFLNSHLLGEVELVCDNVVIIDQGRAVESGPLAELLAPTREVRVTVDRVTPELCDRVACVGTILESGATELVIRLDDPESVPEVARFVVELGLRLYGLASSQRRLEDIFVQVVESRTP